MSFKPMHKRSGTLIASSRGDPFNCAICGGRPVRVVHYNYRWWSPPKDLSSDQASKYKRFDRVVERAFLCRDHWASEYFNNPAFFEPETGEATFSSVELPVWRRIEYEDLEEIMIKIRGDLELKS